MATQLVAGAVDAAVLNLAEAGSQIEAGDVCPIVVLANNRMAALPDVSTAQEMGIPVSFSTVRGFVVHKDTPDAVAEKNRNGFDEIDEPFRLSGVLNLSWA